MYGGRQKGGQFSVERRVIVALALGFTVGACGGSNAEAVSSTAGESTETDDGETTETTDAGEAGDAGQDGASGSSTETTTETESGDEGDTGDDTTETTDETTEDTGDESTDDTTEETTEDTGAPVDCADYEELPDVGVPLRGHYTGESFGGVQWVDLSGNDHSGFLVSGLTTIEWQQFTTGADLPVVVGSDKVRLRWNTELFASPDYTFVHVSRYHQAAVTEQRIFQARNGDWCDGHWGGMSGVARRGDSFITDTDESEFGNDWAIYVSTNSMHRGNGMDLTTQPCTGECLTFVPELTINWGFTDEDSDFAVAELAVYDGQLDMDQITEVENYLNCKFGLF